MTTFLTSISRTKREMVTAFSIFIRSDMYTIELVRGDEFVLPLVE